MESVVVLCNQLRQMMVNQSGAKPSLATLNKAFATYQKQRQERVKHIMDYSGLITNVQAWRKPMYKLLANWLLPLQPDRAVADQLGKLIRNAPKLDFVDVTSFPSGRLPWADDENRKAEKQKQEQKKQKTMRKVMSKGSSGWELARLMQVMSAALALGLVVFVAQYLRPLVMV